MQRLDDVRAGALGRMMIDDPVDTAGFQCGEDPPVQFTPILVGEPQVVVGQHDDDRVQRTVRR